MNKILFILAFLLTTTCKEAVEKTETNIESNINLKGNGVLKNQKFIKSYIGKIGKNDVVFHLIIQNASVSGYYFYQRKGINIKLIGTLKNEKVVLHELDINRNKIAIIEAKINQNKITGAWKSLKNKKKFNLNLEETDLKIPEIPAHILGKYEESKLTDCNFNLTISKKFNEYFYDIKSENIKLKGKIIFNRSLEEQKVFITFEGIEWAEYEGALDDEGEPINQDLETPIGIEGLWQEEEIFIQNYGNSMNYYTKFSGCGEKYIILQKLSKPRDKNSTFYEN